MQNINDLEQALESLKALIKAKKDYEKLSAKYANVSFKDVTRSQRARINERLGHIYRAAYLPKVPKRYKELQK